MLTATAKSQAERELMVRVKPKQRHFTEQEVCGLTGICLDHLRALAQSRHLGLLFRVAGAAAGAGVWLFTQSDLLVLAMLHPRCEHQPAANGNS